MRRALPPSAPMTLRPDQETFSQTIQLPVRGQPSQYPFDDYLLWLGLSGTVSEGGKKIDLTPELLAKRVVITTQNQLRDFLMVPPTEIDPALRLLTRMLVMFRLVSPESDEPPDETKPLVAAACGHAEWNALLAAHDAARQRVAELWRRVASGEK